MANDTAALLAAVKGLGGRVAILGTKVDAVVRADASAAFSAAKAQVAALGFTLKDNREWNEYILAPKSAPGQTYHSDDLTDIIGTAKDMARRGVGARKDAYESEHYTVEFKENGRSRRSQFTNRQRAKDFFETCKSDPNCDSIELWDDKADRELARSDADKPKTPMNGDYGTKYNAEAVNKAISKDKRIKPGEAKLIHGLLKGWRKDDAKADVAFSKWTVVLENKTTGVKKTIDVSADREADATRFAQERLGDSEAGKWKAVSTKKVGKVDNSKAYE